MSIYVKYLFICEVYINKLINQSTNKSINKLINQSTNKSINQIINQSINQLINQSIKVVKLTVLKYIKLQLGGLNIAM